MVKRLSGNIAGGTGGGGTTSPGGSDTQVQFNDGGAFGGDGGLTYNKTTDELTVAGDINLDDGGTFSTTVQSVTPTANRTISFPDATGTVALVSGSNGTVQYNEGGVLKGNSDFTVDPDWNDASTVFTGLKLNVTDTASAAGSNLLDLQVGGTSQFELDSGGTATYKTFLVSGNSGSLQSNNRKISFWMTPIPPSLGLASDVYIGWGSSLNDNSVHDIALARDSAGVVKITDGSTGTGYLRQVPIAVASLPTAAAGNAGTRIFVSDASVAAAGNFGSVVAGGGSNTVPVYSDGGAWRIG